MRFRCVLASLLILLSPALVLGQSESDVSAAYDYAAKGLHAFDTGQNEEALDKLSRAYAMVRLPSLGLFVARTDVKMGRFLAAAQVYAEAAQLPDGPGEHAVQEQARKDAVSEREALLQQIPKLTATTSGVPTTSVTFRIDGDPAPVPDPAMGWSLDPGPHKITAISGSQQLEQQLLLNASEAKTIRFEFLPPPPAAHQQTPAPAPPIEPPPRSNPLRTAGWITMGVGGTALAVAGTTLVWAMIKKDALDHSGPWSVNYCEFAASPQSCNQYRTLRTVSAVSLYTGLGAASIGAVLLLVAPKQHRHSSGAVLVPWVGVGSAGLTGTF